MSLQRVKLRKNKDYVFCYKKGDIIEEEDCDYYQHNLECDRNDDFFGRTHTKGSNAGYIIRGESGPVLNSCDYCLKEVEEYKEYVLPEKASKIYRIQHKKKKELFGWLKR